MSHRHDPEMLECRECGTEFDLARQYYYDNLCPSCKEDDEDEDTTNPTVGTCYVCDADVRARQSSYSRKAAPPDIGGGDGVLVCPDHRNHRYTPDVETSEQIRAMEEKKRDNREGDDA